MIKSLAVILACLATPAFADGTRDLVFIAGQSNAVGFNAKPSELPTDAADRDILFWWRCGDPLPTYEKKLDDMITALRKDLEAPQLIALLGINTRFGGDKNAFVPQIVVVQKALATKDPRCAYVDTATATVANAAHFDTAGTLDVGNRFAEALMKVEGNPAR